MSLRLFASKHFFPTKHLAALALAGLAVGATPATAGGLQLIAPQPVQYYSGSCGGCGGYYVQQPQTYTTSCGGCGTTYVITQPAPQPRYYSGSCGGCGYTAPQPQPTYYATSCGGCGYTATQPVVQPQYEDDDQYVTRRHYRRHVEYRHHRHHSRHWRHANTY
jgi:hypothetical protein